jgi:hypothetical protein
MATVPTRENKGTQANLEPAEMAGLQVKGRLSDKVRGIIFGLRHIGVSKSAVSRACKVDIKTVTRVETAFLDDMAAAVKEIPGFAERRENTPPPTQPEEPETIAKRRDTVYELMMKEKAEGSGSSAAVRQRLKELLGVVWSAKTIERDLHARGYTWKARPVTSALTEGRMRKRVLAIPDLLKAYSRKKMIFTDESMFRAVDMRSTHQWCQEDEQADPVRKDAWSAKVHVWGAIADDFSELVFLSGPVDSADYIDTLRRFLMPLIEGRVHEYVLMQDGAPAHRAKATMEYIASVGLEVASWPPYSADLNPIENVWATMKGRCEVDCFSTQPEVYEAILDVWRGMSQDFLRGYVESFPQRCEDVLAVNGDDAKLAPKIRNR